MPSVAPRKQSDGPLAPRLACGGLPFLTKEQGAHHGESEDARLHGVLRLCHHDAILEVSQHRLVKADLRRSAFERRHPIDLVL